MPITPNTSKLDFQDIKNNLKVFLQSQETLQDYNYEGSALNAILDVLAYTTHYNAFNANMAVNESFLDTSQIRSSVVSHAKLLGYTPRSNSGAKVLVKLVIPQVDGNQGTYTLNSGTKFSALSNTDRKEPLTFINTETVEASGNGTEYIFTDLELMEGVYKQDIYRFHTNTSESFYLTDLYADTSTLLVSVRESSTSTYEEVYSPIKHITDVTKDSNVYWLQENKNGMFSISFGDGKLGKKLDSGNIITLTYVAVNESPESGNNIKTITDQVGDGIVTLVRTGDDGVTEVPVLTAGGSGKESIESIKFNSPLTYVAQNRAVTVDDYRSIIRNEIPDVKSINIWGGETETPPKNGRVMISIVPGDGEQLDIPTKQSILDNLNTKSILSIVPEVVDFKEIELDLEVSFKYSPNLLTKDKLVLEQNVSNVLLKYNVDELQKFDGVFRTSNVLNLIDSSDISILSSSIITKLTKKENIHSLIDTLANVSSAEWSTADKEAARIWSFEIPFSNRLNHTNNTISILSTDKFTFRTIECKMTDVYNTITGIREIHIIRYDDNSIVMKNIGTIDLFYGKVVINKLNCSFDELPNEDIKFIVLPWNNDIFPKFNTLLKLSDNITINAIKDNLQ